MEEKNNLQSVKRNIAIKVNISDIINGEYVKEDGWTPNYVSTNKGHVSRVNIIGVIVSKEDSDYNTLMVDDSTGAIAVRSFENKDILKTPLIGQIILLVGRVREYNGQKYILAEIIKVISDKKWVLIRKKELEKDIESFSKKKTVIKEEKKDFEATNEQKKEVIIPKKEEMMLQPQSNPYEVVLSLIKSSDTGFGVSYEEIILNSKLKNCEEIITSLIEEGEIFEVRPGILKVL
jgi:RPA family protein